MEIHLIYEANAKGFEAVAVILFFTEASTSYIMGSASPIPFIFDLNEPSQIKSAVLLGA